MFLNTLGLSRAELAGPTELVPGLGLGREKHLGKEREGKGRQGGQGLGPASPMECQTLLGAVGRASSGFCFWAGFLLARGGCRTQGALEALGNAVEDPGLAFPRPWAPWLSVLGLLVWEAEEVVIRWLLDPRGANFLYLCLKKVQGNCSCSILESPLSSESREHILPFPC